VHRVNVRRTTLFRCKSRTAAFAPIVAPSFVHGPRMATKLRTCGKKRPTVHTLMGFTRSIYGCVLYSGHRRVNARLMTEPRGVRGKTRAGTSPAATNQRRRQGANREVRTSEPLPHHEHPWTDLATAVRTRPLRAPSRRRCDRSGGERSGAPSWSATRAGDRSLFTTVRVRTGRADCSNST